MADARTYLCYSLIIFVKLVSATSIERLTLDKNLTRQEITTFLGRPVNIGCYVTKNNTNETLQTKASSPITYVWLKSNNSISQTKNSRSHGNVLVVTPKDDTDFGTYQCDVTNGVSSTQCRIELKRGWTKAERIPIVTGCVNVSVLMPVLAVAVLSFLLFVHLLIKKRDTKKPPPETPEQELQRRRHSSIMNPHAEQRMETRRLSRDLLYNSFRDGVSNNNESKPGVVSVEMHVGGDLQSTPESKAAANIKRERRRSFYKRSFRNASMELDDVDVSAHVSGDIAEQEERSPKDIGFYNANFKNESTDSGVDYSRASANTSLDETIQGEDGTLKGFYNKTFKNESVEEDDADDVFAKRTEELTVAEKSKSGKAMGFFNKTFHTSSMDIPDEGDEGASASGSVNSAVGEAKDDTAHVPTAVQDVFQKKAEEMTVAEKSKSGKAMGFFNKTFHTSSMDIPDEGDDGASASGSGNSAVGEAKDTGHVPTAVQDVFQKKAEEMTVAEKSKSGKAMGFFNKTFHSDSIDIPDDGADDASASGSSGTAVSESKDDPPLPPEEDTYF